MGLLLVTFDFMSIQGVNAQQTVFPYRAQVVGEDAVVRSGPGTTHYGTDRLSPGMEVEVYRHDPGGWIAIRPPKNSFSLVQRDEIELYEDGLAKVVEPDTVAWVGTRLNPVKNPMWQIKLRKGEVLEVLGVVDRQQYELGTQEPDWVQVQPPAGEFRWIASTDIRALPETASNELSDQDVQDLQINPVTPNNQQRPVPFDSWEPEQNPGEWTLDVETDGVSATEHAAAGNAVAADPGWKPARQTITNFVEERSGFLAENESRNMYTNNWNMSQQTGAEPSQGSSSVRSEIFDAESSANYVTSPATATTLMTPNFEASDGLQTLEMRLSHEMINKSPADWDLFQLAADVERARANATNQQDARFLDRLMEKIRNCREIKAGFRASGGSGGAVDTPTNLQTMRTHDGANTQAGLLYNYDAHGILNELVRNGGTGPSTYVLQDANGKITHHISAPPGVNLRRYVNQRVGIIGNRGFHQQLNLEHVTAERVITIDTLRR